ncbi:MAG TPA: flagellin [Alphaproteobacteria bacterium]
MALNVISNFAANVAHRHLVKSDMEATGSLAKLSAGTRVLAARDDAASLAIGSRLNAEVHAIRQASVNAGHAVSMLQIADGAMARVSDILIRMKTLSVQAGSGHLSITERSMLDAEYQNLLAEIDRIAADTEFNGVKMVNGSQSVQTMPAGLAVADGVSSVNLSGFDLFGATTSAAYSIGYASATRTFTLTDGSTNWTGSIAASAVTSDLTNQGLVVTLQAAGSSAEMSLGIAAGFSTNSNVASATITLQGNSTTSFSFKVGSGTVAAEDEVTVTIDGIGTTSLTVNGTSITTKTNADVASNSITTAVDNLNTSRANLGAAQNRIEFAAANIATTIENTESARSDLMDLDLASEMSYFTSRQILLQAGVAMLAQANQMPQNLLRLFQ